jgi:hypothetical protein
MVAGATPLTARQPVDLRDQAARPVPLSDNLLQQIISRRRSEFGQMNLFDCATRQSFSPRAGAQRTFAMIEMVTAVMGLLSAGIFLAHAFEGYRYRA